MRAFAEIEAMAAAHSGGADKLAERLATHPVFITQDGGGQGDDRWLSRLSQYVFSAGFNWKVVENKWPDHERAFHNFDLDYCADLSLDQIGELLSDKSIIRHGAKVKSVKDNAIFLQNLAAEHGKPAGQVIMDWPDSDYIGLLEMMKKRGSRLGGNSVQYALRSMGKSCFILSNDVNAALIREGVLDKPATSKADMKKAQEAFNHWQTETGKSMTDLSRILAFSVG